MKLLNLLPLLFLSISLYSQVVYDDGYIRVEIVDLLARDSLRRDSLRKLDYLSDVNDGRITTKLLYSAYGNDLDNDKIYDHYGSEIKYKLIDTLATKFEVDHHTDPRKFRFAKTDFILDLVRVEDSVWATRLDYSPFIIFYVDSMVTYTTGLDFDITLIYEGRLIKSFDINFAQITKKSYDLAAEWYYTSDERVPVSHPTEKDVLALWLSKTFGGDFDYCRSLLDSQKFTFYYTNTDYYIGEE
jgi:hypothetical protein